MATNFELQAEKREQFGTSVSRRMRRESGRVPAVVYGGGQSPQPITLSHDEIIVALGQEGFYSNIVSLTIGDKPQQVILKALQRHPYKNKVLHLDFMRVKANEKLTVKIPLHFKGGEEAPGVKEQGGVVTHHCNDIEVRCLPKHLPEFIEIDVSAMQLDEMLHLSDVKLAPEVEIVALALGENHDAPVASVHMPRVVEEPVVEEEAEGEEGVTEGEAGAKDEGEAASSDKKADADKSDDNKS
ncbi:MAG: 50S ribosomal protein L25/general stress protein Ctc [Gammaproteobacteria bacterium]|nr:50S ribosomal protein L25/general stress protein Ctc [Gammaproteobacteria bacterium]